MQIGMPKISRLSLPPLNLSKETIGERMARLRKDRSYTQRELAERVGIIHGLVSDYEKGKLRLYDQMVMRFALALQVSADEILGMKGNGPKAGKPKSQVCPSPWKDRIVAAGKAEDDLKSDRLYDTIGGAADMKGA